MNAQLARVLLTPRTRSVVVVLLLVKKKGAPQAPFSFSATSISGSSFASRRAHDFACVKTTSAHLDLRD
ncbi:MAG: hypothetical protein ACJ8AC_10730, partial [Gemmatimonadaceae bacterium]